MLAATLITFLAQTAGGSDPFIDRLLAGGVACIVLAAVIVGLLVPKPSVDQLKADKAAAELARDKLVDKFQTEVIPALLEFNRVGTALLPLLTRLVENELGRTPTQTFGPTLHDPRGRQ